MLHLRSLVFNERMAARNPGCFLTSLAAGRGHLRRSAFLEVSFTGGRWALQHLLPSFGWNSGGYLGPRGVKQQGRRSLDGGASPSLGRLTSGPHSRDRNTLSLKSLWFRDFRPLPPTYYKRKSCITRESIDDDDNNECVKKLYSEAIDRFRCPSRFCTRGLLLSFKQTREH